MQALLLASASPARRRLLDRAAIPHPYAVIGVTKTRLRPRALQLAAELRFAKRLARAKAERWPEPIGVEEASGWVAIPLLGL